jgi:hypothetical protein
MDRRDRPVLNQPRERLTLIAVELRRLAPRLAVNQTFRAIGIETQHPIPDHLKPDAANPRRIRTTAAIINLRQGEKSAALPGILRCPGKSAQVRTIKIFPQSNC